MMIVKVKASNLYSGSERITVCVMSLNLPRFASTAVFRLLLISLSVVLVSGLSWPKLVARKIIYTDQLFTNHIIVLTKRVSRDKSACSRLIRNDMWVRPGLEPITPQVKNQSRNHHYTSFLEVGWRYI